MQIRLNCWVTQCGVKFEPYRELKKFPKNFLWNFFLSKNFFRLKKICGKKCLPKKILSLNFFYPKYFLVKKIFGIKKLGTKFFGGRNFFWLKNFFGQHFFSTIFFAEKSFLTKKNFSQKFFGKKYFWDKYFSSLYGSNLRPQWVTQQFNLICINWKVYWLPIRSSIDATSIHLHKKCYTQKKFIGSPLGPQLVPPQSPP